MKNTFFILSILFIGLTFGSCKNDVANEENIETGVFKFTYHGDMYQTSYTKIGESIVYNDETVGNFYKELQKIPTLATLIKEDDSVELFDSFEELLPKPKDTNDVRMVIKTVNNPQVSSCRFTLYTGSMLTGTFTTSTLYVYESEVNSRGNSNNYESCFNGAPMVQNAIKSFSLKTTNTTGGAWDTDIVGIAYFFDNVYATGQSLSFLIGPETANRSIIDLNNQLYTGVSQLWVNKIQMYGYMATRL